MLIERSADLDCLFEALAREIVRAHNYYRLYQDLRKSSAEYGSEFQLSNTFWVLTTDALLDATLLHVCRIYDQHNDALSIKKLLATIQSHTAFFGQESFKERLSQNTHVDSLAEQDRIPNQQELIRDCDAVSAKDELVNKLVKVRSNGIAHRNALMAVGKNDVLAKHPISNDDFQSLLNRCRIIYNIYLYMYSASVWSVDTIGQEDYKSLLETLRIGIAKREEDVQKELAQWKGIVAAADPAINAG